MTMIEETIPVGEKLAQRVLTGDKPYILIVVEDTGARIDVSGLDPDTIADGLRELADSVDSWREVTAE